MSWIQLLRRPAALAPGLLVTAVAVAGAQVGGAAFDRWIHPRGQAFDPARHYKDANGEVYYQAENDIGAGVAIRLEGGSRPRMIVDLGPDLWKIADETGGHLRPVFLYDADGDGRVDRSLGGRLEGHAAIFDLPDLAAFDFRGSHWQLGVAYDAGDSGSAAYDGRYLASVDSQRARVDHAGLDELPPVGAGVGAGVFIFKHQADKAFDLGEFARSPQLYLQDFDELTPDDDADDWTVKGKKGRLRTHFEREDLLLIRTTATLDIKWGDMPLAQFLEQWMEIEPGPGGCYNSLDSRIVGVDGVHAPVPHRMLYCPDDAYALFDAPDGYQIFVSAKSGETLHNRTEITTSILDNVQLYAAEVNPRSPRTRGTGSAWGNIAAGLKDAGLDLRDAGQHLITGKFQRNIHTGQLEYRHSPFTAIPATLYDLVRLRPDRALNDLVEGAQSGLQVVADSVSSVSNAVVNPLVQTTIGVSVSPEAADATVHWFGSLFQAVAQNLIVTERSTDALSPVALWHHNRAFQPSRFTRTDTQLNIDRVMTVANGVLIKVIIEKSGSSNDNARRGGDGKGRGARTKRTCDAPVAPNGNTPTPNRSLRALQVLGSKFCQHPTLTGFLPVRF